MISSVYSYYLTTYGDRGVNKYDTHKKSELRNVYNSMLKVNKNSPLYKIVDSEKVQKYAIDLKETARELKNVASSLTNEDGSILGFSKRKASSSNTRVVDAKYIGEDSDNEDVENVEDLDILVSNMAKPQVNTGNYLNPSGHALLSGGYSFDLGINGYTYEFSFQIGEGEDNKDVQEKISRLINRSNIGVISRVIGNDDGKTALTIASTNTGVSEFNGTIFKVTSNEKNDIGDPVSAYGLDMISKSPENARFTINGVEHSASSNVFSIKRQFEISINDISREGEKAVVGLKPDFDAVVENIQELIDSYNGVVELAKNYEDENHGQLIKELNNVAKRFKESLDTSGFMVQNDGSIKMDEALLIQAANEDTLSENLENLNRFKMALVKKTDEISVNPMHYVNKKLIAYPHPISNFSKPYVSSIYSGMMYNGYV